MDPTRRHGWWQAKIGRHVFAGLVAASAVSVWPGAPAQAEIRSAQEIMARVAASQDRAVQLRREFIFRQAIDMKVRNSSGKLLREEDATYTVFPTSGRTERKLERFTGRYLHNGSYVEFDHEPGPDPDSIDAEVIKEFRDALLDPATKDGIGGDFFPLTSSKQKTYRFDLLGTESVNGRTAYRIVFQPADKNEVGWKGEALVDAEEYSPIRVFTSLSRKLPLPIRTILGTDVPGVGFSIVYKRVAEGVWFPESFGTEFRIQALFFLKRQVSVSMKSEDFRRTNAESLIKFGDSVK